METIGEVSIGVMTSWMCRDDVITAVDYAVRSIREQVRTSIYIEDFLLQVYVFCSIFSTSVMHRSTPNCRYHDHHLDMTRRCHTCPSDTYAQAPLNNNIHVLLNIAYRYGVNDSKSESYIFSYLTHHLSEDRARVSVTDVHMTSE